MVIHLLLFSPFRQTAQFSASNLPNVVLCPFFFFFFLSTQPQARISTLSAQESKTNQSTFLL
jgi:hypothetical protein